LSLPRILITAPASGSGKTLLTCGILQALKNRGLEVASFKCGPDYIDPMFHSRVIGTPSKNLDPYFTDRDVMRYLFERSAKDADISVIEGVMGFYDGLGAATTEGSTYDVSQRLDSPVILVVNCRGASLSAVPIIKGFKEFRGNNIKAVILNNMSEKVYMAVSEIIEKETGVKPIGYVPKVSDLVLESRHLGLCLPDEIDDLKSKLNRLADVLESTIDMDYLIKLSKDVSDLRFDAPSVKKTDRRVRIALADDEAFCFTYEDNIRLLEECGAEIVRFSPIGDAHLPDDVDGLILSGGYPELHCKALSENRTMLDDIRSKVSGGLPCIAECGGFMYLHDTIEDDGGTPYGMVGLIHASVSNRHRLNRFGYISITSKDGSSIPGDMCVKGHEFHYWDSDDCGDDCVAVKPSNGKSYGCMHCHDNLVAGFPHLYYYSNPDFAYRFIGRCEIRSSASRRDDS